MNRYQEALNNVKRVYVESEHYDEEDIRLLQELVDKAIPKKPYTKMNEHNHIDRHCPVCNSFVYSFDIYCGRCGQKMRSDEDDE